MASTLTTFASLLKERYLDTSDVVEKLMYPESPLLGMLKKRGDEGMVGDKMPIPVQYKLPQGFSGSFSTSQTNADNTKQVQFDLVTGDYFGVVHIGDKVLKSSRTNKGAFLENKMYEMDGLFEQGGDNLSQYLWGNGGNSIGSIGAIDSGNDLVTLANPEDIANFELDQYIGASANDGSDSSHTLRGSPSYTQVTSINRSSGVIGLDVSDISGLAVGDYLFRQSDFFGDQSIVVIGGSVRQWISDTDTPPALFSVAAATRDDDPHRLGGIRIASNSVSGKDMEERIKIYCAQATGRFKAKAPTAAFMHPERFAELDTLMSGRGLRALEDQNTKFGYMKIDVVTPAGRIPIYCDRHCPKNDVFFLRMEDWWLTSIDQLLHAQQEDGVTILRRDSTTDYEFRVLSYSGVACRAPKNSGRVSLVN